MSSSTDATNYPNPFDFSSVLAMGSYAENQFLFEENKVGWKWYNCGKRAATTLISAIVRDRILRERTEHFTNIDCCEIDQGPLFVIGHWRSGTTFMHNLLACDNQLAWLSFAEALCIRHSLVPSRVGKRLVSFFIPKKRPHDGVAIGARKPQEDEFAFSNYSRHSCYHGLNFPQFQDHYFQEYLDPSQLPTVKKEAWIDQANYLYKKLTYRSGGKMVLSKNPPHTSRILFLKELYPNCKFVYLVRKPIDVYCSGLAFFEGLLKKSSFQSYNLESYNINFAANYKLLMQNVVDDVSTLPRSDFAAVHYDDLMSDTAKTLLGVYRQLNLAGYNNAKASFDEYLQQMNPPEQRQYDASVPIRNMIKKEWDPIYEDQMQNLPFV